MCQDCGCNASNSIDVVTKTHQHKIEIERGILSKNDRLAAENRQYFQDRGLLVINVFSAPGSGKTKLIERILQDSDNSLNIGIIVGDLATDNDARRLQSKCSQVIQITTGNACHLEADMVAKAARKLDLDDLDLLIIENVGNLVCPAAYDLGEDFKLVMLSVTEGEDKPLKYPTMFKSARVVIINKIDLAEAAEFDKQKAISNIQNIAPQAQIFQVSAKTGQGINSFCNYLSRELLQKGSVAKNFNE